MAYAVHRLQTAKQPAQFCNTSIRSISYFNHCCAYSALFSAVLFDRFIDQGVSHEYF
jgi:hypothetical protein